MLVRHPVQFEAPTGNVAEWASGYSWCHAAGGHYDKVVKESENMLRCHNQPLVQLWCQVYIDIFQHNHEDDQSYKDINKSMEINVMYTGEYVRDLVFRNEFNLTSLMDLCVWGQCTRLVGLMLASHCALFRFCIWFVLWLWCCLMPLMRIPSRRPLSSNCCGTFGLYITPRGHCSNLSKRHWRVVPLSARHEMGLFPSNAHCSNCISTRGHSSTVAGKLSVS